MGGAHFASRVCVCISECAPPPPVCVCEDNIEHKANIAKDALIDSAARPNGAGELSLPEYKYSLQGSGMQVTRQDKTARRICDGGRDVSGSAVTAEAYAGKITRLVPK